MSDFTDRLDRIEALLRDGKLSYDALPLAKLRTYMEENLELDASTALIPNTLPLAHTVLAPTSVPPPLVDSRDGQIIYYVAHDANSIIWQFRYRTGTATPYKWEFIGGSWYHTETSTAAVVPAGAYADIGGGVPTLTIPRDGDYHVEFGCNFTSASVTADVAKAGISINGAAPTGNLEIIDASTTSGNTEGGSYARAGLYLAATAGDTLKHQYTSVNGVTTVDERWLRIKPTRIR